LFLLLGAAAEVIVVVVVVAVVVVVLLLLLQTHAVRGHPNKQVVNPHNLELTSESHVRKAERHYSEQKIPSSQQPVHLITAS
jgi:hypothetical protein